MTNSKRPGAVRGRPAIISKPEGEKMELLEQMVVCGKTNVADMARTLGVTGPTVRTMLDKMRLTFSSDDRFTVKQKRGTRIRQLQHIHQIALDHFTKSLETEVEVTTTSMRCSLCSGKGIIKSDDELECPDCDGNGKQEIVKTRVKKRTGDSSYLKIASGCVQEAAKMEGIYINNSGAKATVKRLLAESKRVGGEIETRVEELYIEAPVDLILEAKRTIEKLRMDGIS